MPVQTVEELKAKLGILRDLKLIRYEVRNEFVGDIGMEEADKKIILALEGDGKWYIRAVDVAKQLVDWAQVQ